MKISLGKGLLKKGTPFRKQKVQISQSLALLIILNPEAVLNLVFMVPGSLESALIFYCLLRFWTRWRFRRLYIERASLIYLSIFYFQTLTTSSSLTLPSRVVLDL